MAREKERLELETVRMEEQRKAMEAKKEAWEEAKKFKDEEQRYKAGDVSLLVQVSIPFKRHISEISLNHLLNYLKPVAFQISWVKRVIQLAPARPKCVHSHHETQT